MIEKLNQKNIALLLAIIAGMCFFCNIEQAHAETTYFIYDSPGRSVTTLTNQSGNTNKSIGK